MAGDWVKMRVNLRKHAKTIAMARYLSAQREFMDWWSDPVRITCKNSVTEIVTISNVTRVTVCGLLEVWGSINQTVKGDLRIPYMCLEDIDGIAEIPCFGQAMQHVGWVGQFSENKTEGLIFPNFSEFNTTEHARKEAKSDAQRASEYRARKKAEKKAEQTRHERHVTSRREEKSIKELKEQDQKQKQKPPVPPLPTNGHDLLGDATNGKKPRAKREGLTFTAWMDSLPEGVAAIPGNDSIFAYADKANIPREYLKLAWIAFESQMSERKTTQKDWPAHFRNAVKNDWFKLWRFNAAGQCYLTTVGMQIVNVGQRSDA